jgi:hypothetical protein
VIKQIPTTGNEAKPYSLIIIGSLRNVEIIAIGARIVMIGLLLLMFTTNTWKNSRYQDNLCPTPGLFFCK